MIDKTKHEILNFLVHDIFNGITEKDVLRVSGKNVIMAGKVLGGTVRKELADGAVTLQQMFVWQAVLTDMKALAMTKLREAKTEEDLYFAKAVLWSLDVIEQKIEHLKKLA